MDVLYCLISLTVLSVGTWTAFRWLVRRGFGLFGKDVPGPSVFVQPVGALIQSQRAHAAPARPLALPPGIPAEQVSVRAEITEQQR
jgi:hypothetical protein